ncbi:hypothetical protein SDC9_22892 [bioreactor metagenome]|uniref:Asparaginase n=1 Tax=bioreactor metagenome TaxID=1076179 RepID=A0A644UDV5_9ZZZZ|nr:asparaginase [Negativicutes bacterium]
MSEILLNYTRGGKVESLHRGDIAVVDVKGNLVDHVGNPDLLMFWRSAAKPFQVLPFVARGGINQFQIRSEELALMVSSHSGEQEHVDLVRKALEKVGLTEAALACGTAKPMNSKAAKAIMMQNQKYQAVHNACSGKHTGMLALAKMLGVPVEGYTDPDHPVQKLMHQAVAEAAGLKSEQVEIGIDGCGVPVFYLPLKNMAYAYSRLAKPEEGNWGERTKAVVTIRDAMLAHPSVVAGTGRIDTALMRLTKGRILAKIGAEAVYCLAAVNEGIGITFKIEDGSYRAINPTVIGILKRLDLITADEHEELLRMFPPILKNHRGDIIGTIETLL